MRRRRLAYLARLCPTFLAVGIAIAAVEDGLRWVQIGSIRPFARMSAFNSSKGSPSNSGNSFARGGERASLHHRRIRIARCGSSGSKRGELRTRLRPRSKCPSVQVPIADTSDRFLKCPRSSPKRPRTVPTRTLEDGSGTLANCVRCLCHAGLDTWTLHRGGCVDL
jgi:hypothetical protein